MKTMRSFKNKKEMFEKLSQDDANENFEQLKKNPNSKIALDEQRRRGKKMKKNIIFLKSQIFLMLMNLRNKNNSSLKLNKC